MNRLSQWITPPILLVLVGCATVQPSASATVAPSATASATPPSAAAVDLDHLLETLEATHPEPFHGIEREAFVAALDAYEASLPDLTAEQSVVELMRVVALLSAQGRDGHQFAMPAAGNEGPVLPLRIYEFAEGVFVTDAPEPYTELVGARLTAINGTPIADVLAAAEPLVPRDGPATVPAFRPVFLLRTEVLRGLGIIGPGAVTVAHDGPDGDGETTLEPMPFAGYVAWAGNFGMLHLPQDPEVTYLAAPAPLSIERLEDGTTLYLHYRNVVPPDVGAARDELADGGIERLVLDLRQNPGGDNTTYGPILSLVRDFATDNPGALFVLTDRITFSAAANLATEIEQRTDATFVGEPMGGGLNFWDDVRFVRLDGLPVPMQVGVSTRYWQKAEAADPRLTIEPDIRVEVLASDYFGHRDPVLEAVLGTQ